MVTSGATLVRGLKKVLDGMSGVGSSIDDIVVYSNIWEEHLRKLKELLGWLRKAWITAHLQTEGTAWQDKESLDYSPTYKLLARSYYIGGNVISLSHDYLAKVRNTSHPTNKKQVRSFLGLVGYYMDHIPAFAEISVPLTNHLRKGKAEHIQWSKAQEHVYSLLKEYLLQDPVLKLPDFLVIRVKDRHIQIWGGGCVTTRERWEAVSSGLCQQEVKPGRGKIPYCRRMSAWR